jgi:hypothetical protein
VECEADVRLEPDRIPSVDNPDAWMYSYSSCIQGLESPPGAAISAGTLNVLACRICKGKSIASLIQGATSCRISWLAPLPQKELIFLLPLSALVVVVFLVSTLSSGSAEL